MPKNLVPPSMSLVPLELAPALELRASESELNPYVGPLRGMPETPETLCLTQPQLSLAFTTRN